MLVNCALRASLNPASRLTFIRVQARSENFIDFLRRNQSRGLSSLCWVHHWRWPQVGKGRRRLRDRGRGPLWNRNWQDLSPCAVTLRWSHWGTSCWRWNHSQPWNKAGQDQGWSRRRSRQAQGCWGSRSRCCPSTTSSSSCGSTCSNSNFGTCCT